MKRLAILLAIALVIAVMAPAFAAPLFPDVPENHWGRDAVADLAAKGIIEGYPDGTFKGDRAATRWEMAVALQRLLAKMEAVHATLATKADLEALRALVNNLKDELDALGVRVKNLEENVSALDKRVTELERITFEGDFVAKFVTIGLYNKSDVRTAPVFGSRLGWPNWDYSVGSLYGVTQYAPGTVNMANARPLVNGAGFTARARLGVKVKVNKDMDAGIRFAAYTSLGDQIIDAYWGVTAPYLSNNFTANASFNMLTGANNAQVQYLNNQPWTRMTFDKFWLEHKPTNTKIIVGSIEKTNFDSLVLANVPNPNISGRDRSQFEEMRKEQKSMVYAWKYFANDEDATLPFYGIKVSGKTHFISGMRWEVMYSKLPDWPTMMAWNQNLIPDVTSHLAGFNLHFKIRDQYAIKVNFAAVSENSNIPRGSNWYRLVYGNGNGALGNGGFWINPAGQNAPLPMGPTNLAMMIGTQLQYMYGASINYRFEPSNIRVVLEAAGSTYKPTKVSAYTASGWAGRVGIGWTNKPNTLDLDLEYVYTDPYYDAYQLEYYPLAATGAMLQGLSYWPNFSYYSGAYQLHDSDIYPNNRQGVRFGGEYRWKDGNGRFALRAEWLTQAKSSKPALTVNNTFTDPVSGLQGYKPGFIEPVFGLLANNGNTTIYEDKSGTVWHIGGTLEHKFSPSPFKAMVQYDYYNFKRDSNFSNPQTALQRAIYNNNYVDLRNHVFKLGLSYAFNDKFTLNGGVDWSAIHGYHPAFAGLNGVVINAPNNNISTSQVSPWLGFDYEVGKNTEWAFNIRYYNQKDHLTNNVLPKDWSYSGLQLMTQFKVKF